MGFFRDLKSTWKGARHKSDLVGTEDVPYGTRLLIEAHYLFGFLQIARQGKVLLNLLNPTKLSIQQTGKNKDFTILSMIYLHVFFNSLISLKICNP